MKRRDLLKLAGTASTLTALPVTSYADESPVAMPWLKRLFKMYTSANGDAVIEQLELDGPESLDSHILIRRAAERVTLGAMPPDYLIDWHNAAQPTILIPLFGELLVRLSDGKDHIFVHGDILIAEDCQGPGHISGSTSAGALVVTIQLPKTEHCLDSSKTPLDPIFTTNASVDEVIGFKSEKK